MPAALQDLVTNPVTPSMIAGSIGTDDASCTTRTHFPNFKGRRARRKARAADPQTEDPAYKLAFQDVDFLLREDLRPVRFQLELLKPELFLNEANIGSTFVFYGSARIPAPDMADALIVAATNPEQEKIAERLKAKSKYYDVARELARSRAAAARTKMARSISWSARVRPLNHGGRKSRSMGTGAGIDRAQHRSSPRAASQPLCDAGTELSVSLFRAAKDALSPARSCGRGLPGRLWHVRRDVRALDLDSDGQGASATDSLFGRDYWNRVVNFEAMVEEGVIAPHDLDLIHWSEDANEAWDFVRRFYERDGREPEEIVAKDEAKA